MDDVRDAAVATLDPVGGEALATPGVTPSQTVGPFFAFALPWPDGPYVVPAGTVGAVWLRGRVTDGADDAVADALLETWQAGPDGRFPQAGAVGHDAVFRGFGRCPTDADGRYAFLTVLPGAVSEPDGTVSAPHVALAVFGRGLLKPLWTRIYFPDQPQNATDAVLGAIDAERRATLIAERTEDGFRFDIRLQGERETVFFEP